MPDTTTRGFPYPEGTDGVDVAGDIQALAEAVDDMPGIQSYTGTQIGALSAGAKWAGRVVWNSTTGKLQVSNGSTFTDVAAGVDVVTNARTDSYTLVLGDAGKVIEMGKATAQTLTVPPNSSVAFPVGTKVDVVQTGAGATTIAEGSGVTINSQDGNLKLTAQWAGATLIKRATNTWVLIGNLTA
jgi:hypothetical protein